MAAAGAAWAKTPRNQMSLLGKNKLDALLPEQFGDWHHVPSDAIVTPESDDSLAAKLYSQSVGRLYQLPSGQGVMMLIAYGDTQSDQLQLHRPEVCYPAFGFNIVRSEAAAFRLGHGAVVPGRNLTASSPERTERISYWTRIGESLPQSGSEQRLAKLQMAWDGTVPDGVLVRISNIEASDTSAFALNERFAADLIASMSPASRPVLIGTKLSKAMLV